MEQTRPSPRPFIIESRANNCSYCGIHNHSTTECHYYLMDMVASTEEQMEQLSRLAELEYETLSSGKMMWEVPEAVAILSDFGREYGSAREN